ncbi:hypothetical protein HIM_09319 [Hirsutella minnesotensis 3608]|uniref:Uncharacterized protein n=1 Tax=Hirsutella minnesotensis 3608 TaxID=1043627 RepID=A0A0F8A369_9HYPO|nr:hypothetical protein HIM_09319 [Hirsutella minnesotensis 3608]
MSSRIILLFIFLSTLGVAAPIAPYPKMTDASHPDSLFRAGHFADGLSAGGLHKRRNLPHDLLTRLGYMPKQLANEESTSRETEHADEAAYFGFDESETPA